MADRSPTTNVDRAREFLVEQMTRAAQATLPLGQVVVVDDQVAVRDGYAVGHALVMAVDQTRPFDRDTVAGTAAGQLERLGWTTRSAVDGDYRDVRAWRADLAGFGISVLCGATNPVTQWNGHTPSFPVPS